MLRKAGVEHFGPKEQALRVRVKGHSGLWLRDRVGQGWWLGGQGMTQVS